VIILLTKEMRREKTIKKTQRICSKGQCLERGELRARSTQILFHQEIHHRRRGGEYDKLVVAPTIFDEIISSERRENHMRVFLVFIPRPIGTGVLLYCTRRSVCFNSFHRHNRIFIYQHT
jgi:hypothetical protein